MRPSLKTQDAENLQVEREEAWDRVRRRLRAELGDDVFSSWFGRLDLVEIVEGVAQLSVPTRFLKSWIQAHYLDRVRTLVTTECAGVVRRSTSSSAARSARRCAPCSSRTTPRRPQRPRPPRPA